MIIQEIYEKYRVMPSLQVHMLRVTAVASVICDEWRGESIDRECIVKTCLLHDLANILKFDMHLYPDLFQPEGIEYWKEVKEWTKQFGTDEHQATLVMCESLGVEENVIDLLKEFGDYHIHYKVKSSNIALKICEYADLSVTPFGIVSVDKRIEDFRVRMIANRGMTEERADEIVSGIHRDTRVLEGQLFENMAESSCELVLLAKAVDLNILRTIHF